MKITGIEKQKRTENRYNIYVDNTFSFSAETDDLVKLDIKKDKEITIKELNELRELCEETKAYNYALNLIQRRDYSSNEIRNKIRDRSFSDKTIEKIISKLQEYDFINDDKYVHKYINDSMKFKRYGRRRIIYNLENKGINHGTLENLCFDEEVEYRNAYELSVKKAKTLNDSKNKKEKIYRFLVSKGYEYEIIKKVLNNIFKDEF